MVTITGRLALAPLATGPTVAGAVVAHWLPPTGTLNALTVSVTGTRTSALTLSLVTSVNVARYTPTERFAALKLIVIERAPSAETSPEAGASDSQGTSL